ncbi:hypothetical protein [Roseibium sp. MMSF_3412]|nr:hypothetical protein [Roseibium sp. MMSF_3412]
MQQTFAQSVGRNGFFGNGNQGKHWDRHRFAAPARKLPRVRENVKVG